MGERFFLETAPDGDRAVLGGDEARHLVRVLRADVGDEVVVFAGTGREWPARIARVGRDRVDLELGPVRVDPPSECEIVMAVALPKGERQKWLVEKLTELGVARLVPLLTQRGVAAATPAVADRLRRTVIEACKQCGRNTLMDVAAALDPEALVTALPADTVVILAMPGAPPLPANPVARARRLVGVVGPEGGFTAEEVARLEQWGARRTGLAPHVLRVETAAIALAAALQAVAPSS